MNINFLKIFSTGVYLFTIFTISNSHVLTGEENVWSNYSGGVVSLIEDGIVEVSDFLKILEPYKLDKLSPTNKERFVGDLILPTFLKKFFETLEDDGIPRDKLLKGVDNDNCKGHILEIFLRIRDWTFPKLVTDPSYTWLLQMIDSWGKVPEGLLSGHWNSFGDFDECIGVRAKDINILNKFVPDKTENHFNGRYCTVYVADYKTSMGAAKEPVPDPNPIKVKSLPSTLQNNNSIHTIVEGTVSFEELVELILSPRGVQIVPSIGACFPNSCSRTDVQQLLINMMDYIYTREPPKDEEGDRKFNLAQANDNNSAYPTQLLWPFALACYESTSFDFDAADISVIVLLSVIAGIAIIAGIIDFWQTDGVEKPPERGLAMQYFMSFSLYTNFKAWKSTKRPKGDIGCLHGLRFFSTSWIILAHTYYAVSFLPEWNMVDVKKIHEDWLVLTVLNSSFSVETFFVMSGMLVTYSMMSTLQRSKGKLNVLKLYAKRYVRLTPTYAILIGVLATLLPYVGNGPYWFIMNNWKEVCENNWWTNLLYVNNLVNTSFLCQGETWYLGCDMQFYILSPLIVYPMWRWEIAGLVLLGIYTVLSCISPALIVHALDGISPTVIPTRDITDRRSFTHLYIRPYARIGTFLIGIFMGYLLFKTKGKKVKLPLLLVAALWILSTVVTLVSIYSIHPWFNPETEIPKGASIAYAALSRFSFGLVIAWIIFACVKGYGGIVNRFLSWKVFMPLARLCYCVYLVSLHLQMILHVRFKQPPRYDPFIQANFFAAHLVMSFLVGFVLYLLFEAPFMTIQKLIFDGAPKKKKAAPTSIKNDSPDKAGTEESRVEPNETKVVEESNPTSTVVEVKAS